jgi:hypothetical protein
VKGTGRRNAASVRTLTRSVGIALGILALSLGAPGSVDRSVPQNHGYGFDRVSAELAPVRGITVGPIESAMHPGRGYGSLRSADALDLVNDLGGNWISLTPFGRIWDLSPSGIDHTFEAPFSLNRTAIRRTIAQAHARGMKVMLVPHLWVETGGWRGELHFEDDAAWQTWASAYREFVIEWARLAEATHVDLFSVGVELRSWVTAGHAESFRDVVQDVRQVYKGPLTYGANWDDVDHTAIWGDLDVIGINAFFPLTTKSSASLAELRTGALAVKRKIAGISEAWRKPVVFTEVGYTNRPDPALRPWEWPEDLHGVHPAPNAQADAYEALLGAFIPEPWFLGFFVWRIYADRYDTSQEPAWGFSPLNQPAEHVLRDAFATAWGSPNSPM